MTLVSRVTYQNAPMADDIEVPDRTTLRLFLHSGLV